MAKRGPKRVLDRELQYWELMGNGVGTVEACRITGVSRSTGYRWRAEMGGVISRAATTASGRYLSMRERQRIGDLRSQGMSIRAIAVRIGRSPSTVSRELSRNIAPWDATYEPVIAYLRAHERARRPKPGKVASSRWLQRFVQARLDECWSPEQISLHLRRHFPGQPARNACPETIYQALYRPGEGIPRALTRKLRTGRPLRRRQRRPDRRTTRFVAAMRSIHDRPIEVQDRQQPGHWEGDLIIGTKNRSGIGTIVERTSRYTLLVHLSDNKSAAAVTAGVVKTLRRLPEHMRISLTWDRGMEMADYADISSALGMPVFFCDPASPWQRGTNENTNGLLRQYFPKGTDLSVHTPSDLRRIQKELNNRPRKSLSGRTPYEVFTELSATIDPLRCDDR